MTGEAVSNLAVVLSLVFFGVSISAAVVVWRRVVNDQPRTGRYTLAAVILLCLSATSMVYAAWP
ncbi:MAG: hypothetical protein JO079_10535 [Frankiaceae bacterium]|nr:hypothetical protein [Frankiaceae bacterium]